MIVVNSYRLVELKKQARVTLSLIFVLMVSGLLAAPEDAYQIIIKDKKKGLVDAKGNIIIPVRYDDLGWSNRQDQPLRDVIGYREGDLWGLINLKNKKVTAPEYTVLEKTTSPLVIAAKKGTFSKVDFYGVMNTEGKNVIPYQYHRITHYKSRFVATYKDKTNFYQGLLSADNRILIPFKFKLVAGLNDNLFKVENELGQVAIFDRDGNKKYDFKLDNVAMAGDHVSVLHNGRRGLLDPSGDLIANPQFHSISISDEGVNGLAFSKWVILNGDNEKQLEFDADKIRPVGDLYLVQNGDYQWLMDKKGQQLTNPFHEIIWAEDGISVIVKDNKFGLMKSDGKIILRPVYDSIYYKEGFAYVNRQSKGDNRWSIYDTLGVKKTQFGYQQIRPFQDRLFAVKRRGKWGFITRTGQEVIHCVYNSVTDFTENKSVVNFHGETGIINRNGDWIVLPKKSNVQIVNSNLYSQTDGRQTQLRSFEGDLVYFTNNELTRISNYFEEKIGDSVLWNVNFRGTVMDSTQTVEAPDFEDGEINIVLRDGRWGAVSTEGTTIIPFHNYYQELHEPSEGFFGIKLGSGYGFIDYNNQLRIANRYEGISKFKEGRVAFKLLGRWGFMNKYERIVVQPSYDQVFDYYGGIAIVSRDNAYGIINKKGAEVQPIEYQKITRLESGHYQVIKNGKTGLLDKVGRELIIPRYDALRYFGGDRAIVKKGGKYGVVNLDGVSIIPQLYDDIHYNPQSKSFIGKVNPQWVKLQ